MKNQQTQQQETSTTQVNRRKGLKKSGLAIGIIATAFTIIWLTMFADPSSSRLSTPAEIETQKEFQEKLILTQEEFQEKINAATKEAEQKSDL